MLAHTPPATIPIRFWDRVWLFFGGKLYIYIDFHFRFGASSGVPYLSRKFSPQSTLLAVLQMKWRWGVLTHNFIQVGNGTTNP